MQPSSSSSPAPRRPTGELPHCHLELPHSHLELPHSHLELPHSLFAILAGLCSIDTRRVARLAPLHTSSHLFTPQVHGAYAHQVPSAAQGPRRIVGGVAPESRQLQDPEAWRQLDRDCTVIEPA